MALMVATVIHILLLFLGRALGAANKPDPNGYIVYCPCMGRFGNQADQFLGSLAFARGVDRTLVLPPWVQYNYAEPDSMQVPFDRYFQVEPFLSYHRVITMDKFMKTLAPTLWQPSERIIFCYSPRHGPKENDCNAKDGNPFGPFWNHLKIDFVKSEFYGDGLAYDPYYYKLWNERYPPAKYPVLAFTGPPAGFPVSLSNAKLHKYMKWSTAIDQKASKFIADYLEQPFVALHLRNGPDWDNVCKHVDRQQRSLFSSAQCLGENNEHGPLTMDLCSPPRKQVIKQLRKAVDQFKAKSVFVASDHDHMLQDFKKALRKREVSVTKVNSNDPHLDLAILGKADHYIGNCVSSFSAFTKRERDAAGKSSSFWSFNQHTDAGRHNEL